MSTELVATEHRAFEGTSASVLPIAAQPIAAPFRAVAGTKLEGLLFIAFTVATEAVCRAALETLARLACSIATVAVCRAALEIFVLRLTRSIATEAIYRAGIESLLRLTGSVAAEAVYTAGFETLLRLTGSVATVTGVNVTISVRISAVGDAPVAHRLIPRQAYAMCRERSDVHRFAALAAVGELPGVECWCVVTGHGDKSCRAEEHSDDAIDGDHHVRTLR